MRIGCGVYEHVVRGRRYLYFWHYETRGGGRVQVKEYLGPADDPQTRQAALRLCEAYFARVAQDIARLRRSTLLRLKESQHTAGSLRPRNQARISSKR